jgi:cytochrome c oxidase assembly protein subunit 15
MNTHASTMEGALPHASRRLGLLRPFSKLMVIAILLLIFFGGQVKSHDAGLSVPDWPLTYGQNPITYPISEWRGGIFHEHFHRLYAGVVAIMTVFLAIGLQLKSPYRWLKSLGWLAVFAVLLQALLGGLTVWYQLPVLVSSSHATLAQTYLVLIIIIAYGLSREREQRKQSMDVPGRRERWNVIATLALVVIAVLYGQLLLGALMRHTESGLAIPDFPKTAGRWIPRFDDATVAWVNDWRWDHGPLASGEQLHDVTLGQVVLHFSHRAGGLVVLACALGVLYAAARIRAQRPELWRTALIFLALTLTQFTLGMFTVWTQKTPLITSTHVMTGAALLGLCVLILLRAWPIHGRPGKHTDPVS